MSTTLAEIWPPFSLRITCGELSLAAVTDTDLPALVDLAAAGIHEPGRMPFPTPWSALPMPDLGRDLTSRYWLVRAQFRVEEWCLPLVVRWRGDIRGIQGAEATHYPVARTPDTFSWLAADAQGQGLGTRMRQVICAVLFDELDAHEITSGAYLDNPASLAVSRKVGFRPNGRNQLERRTGEAVTHQRLLLTRENFIRPAEPIAVTGAAELRAFAGIAR